jgi:hypothetical protein
MKIHTALVLLSAVGCAGAVGCGSAGGDGTTGTVRASLHRAKSCGDLLGDLKADATHKLNQAISRQISDIQQCVSKYGDESCAYGGGYYGGGGRGEPAMDSGAEAAPSAGSDSGGERASSYSETNVQVQGVDEADIVKTDGQNLYVLHGNTFKVLKAWPATELTELSSAELEGIPSEMFVADGKVVVYSQVNGAAVFQAAGVEPKTQYQDYHYYPGGGWGGGWGGGGARPMPAGDVAGPEPYPGGSSEPYVPLTKITVMTLNGAIPTVSREVYFEGGYLDSRRVGQHVRTVLQGYAHGPKLVHSVYELLSPPPQTDGDVDGREAPSTSTTTTDPYPKTGSAMIAALQQLRTENLSRINASVISDWVPYTFVKEGAQVTAKSVACEDFYVPTTGSTESGLTEVASLDLADPASMPRETAILGRADTVYATADSLYLAANAWVEPPPFTFDDGSSGSGSTGGGDTTEPAPLPTEPSVGTASIGPRNTPTEPTGVTTWATNKTHLHKLEFATEPTFPNYVASGTVTGSVHNQFSLDEKDGFLRVATTESRIYVDAQGRWVSAMPNDGNTPSPRPDMVNHVFVLGPNGSWLDVVGSAKDLAPNERIYSARFVGGRGYIVTFRQVDPLFVLDLNAPQNPVVLGELKIPGFSEYMHPLDENHILTIGRDATDDGQARGLQLQIFDVTNGANPIRKHLHTYTGDEYGSSEAQYDHKAFTYFADRQMLAFPYYAYNYNTGSDGPKSTLELFKVDVGSGFAKLGAIDHSALVSSNPTGYCGGYYGPTVRRGVFMENFVYSVSYGGVVVKDANNLAAQVSQLPLSAPVTNDGYGPSCY